MVEWLNENAGALQTLLQAGVLGVAMVAAVFAWVQTREAAALRREQAQPYLAVDLRQSSVAPTFVEFSISNYGHTAAHNIRVTSDPPLMCRDLGTATSIEPLPLFDVLPTLVPQQEWSTIWANGPNYLASDRLPRVYDVSVSYEDSHGRPLDGSFRLDWTAHQEREFIHTKGLDEIAQSLEMLSKNIKSVVDGGAWITQSKGNRRQEIRETREALRARRATQVVAAPPQHEQPG